MFKSAFNFQVPAILSNGTHEVLDPSFKTFMDLEQRVLEIYYKKKRSKRETQDDFQGRRYIIYDRPPEKKEKKKKR